MRGSNRSSVRGTYAQALPSPKLPIVCATLRYHLYERLKLQHGEDRALLTVFLTLFRYFSFVPKLGSMSPLQDTEELPKVHKPSTANGTKRRERTCIGEAGSGNKLHEFRVSLEEED